MNHAEILMTVMECGGVPNSTYYMIDDDCFNKLLKRFSSYYLEPLNNSEIMEMWVSTSNCIQFSKEIERYHGIE